MDLPLVEKLYKSTLHEDYGSVSELLQQGGNPNTVTKQGKTCLGEAARIGNEKIVKLLIDAYKSTCAQSKNSQNNSQKIPSKLQKRKLRNTGSPEETVTKFKNRTEKSFQRKSSNANYTLQNSDLSDKNQGSFVFTHSAGSSSGTSRIHNTKSPANPTSLVPSLQAELEWDEERVSDAPTTREDETWSSMYVWYATMLESTASVMDEASADTNGIDQQDSFLKTALHYAVELRHTRIVKLIIDAGCNVDVVAGDGLTSLHIAVMKNAKDIVTLLLAAGGQVNYKTHEKFTPLHFAASRGLLEMVKVLVSNGAYLEARDICDRTPLYLATARGYINIINFLISAGANVNGEQIHGYTPLCEAVWSRRTKIIEALLEAGARITHSHRLLHNAIATEQEEILKLLIKKGGSINLYNDSGDTPLLLSARLSQPVTARILLENGANVKSCNSITGVTALHLAVKNIRNSRIFDEYFRCLLEYGIDLDCIALAGQTALNEALMFAKDHATLMLIRHGADVNKCRISTRGLDNLSVASKRRSINLVKFLFKAGHRYPAPDPNYVLCEDEAAQLCLQQACMDPLNLSDICRIQVRRKCGDKLMSSYINSLPIPKILKGFLMFEEIEEISFNN